LPAKTPVRVFGMAEAYEPPVCIDADSSAAPLSSRIPPPGFLPERYRIYLITAGGSGSLSLRFSRAFLFCGGDLCDVRMGVFSPGSKGGGSMKRGGRDREKEKDRLIPGRREAAVSWMTSLDERIFRGDFG